MDELRAPLTTRLRTPALVAGDVVVALLLTMPPLIRTPDPERGVGPAEVLGALAALAVAVRRIWPMPVFCLVLVASVAATAAAAREGFVSDPFLALAFASYPVALDLNERRAAVVAASTLVVVVATAAALPSDVRASRAALAIVAGCLLVASWALGIAVHQHRRYEAMRRARATQDAALRERLRVAREVHDLLAHGMSVIAVQAGVANHVIDGNPSEARRVLASIAGTSRAGLAELRNLMSALRSTEPPEPAALQPAPGIDGLPELLDGVGATGVHADLAVRGERRPVPPGIDLTVYRIVQESLTNVVRHAGAKRCGVEVVYLPDTLTVEIVDDGHGGSAGVRGDGHGLAGMRERVAIYGGVLDAGPVPEPGRGFRVAARLPLRDTVAG